MICRLLLFSSLLLFVSCQSNKMASKEEPVKIILDTDMGSDADDAGALALLHFYADMGKAEILGVIYSSGKVPYGAAISQAINIYYGRSGIPVGADHEGVFGDPVDKMSAGKLARDTTAFRNTIVHNRDTEEQTELNRRLLANSEDKSVTYLTIGHTRGLYKLLTSDPDEISPLSGMELVQQKVERWIALGALGAHNEGGYFVRDWNFFFNDTQPYTKYLVENFPSDAVFVDAGHEIMTGKSLKGTPRGNIVRTAYRDWLWWNNERTLDDQRPSWDLVAVHYAVHGPGEWLVYAPQGWLEYDLEEGSRWNLGDSDRSHSYLMEKEGIRQEFADYLNEMIGRTPKKYDPELWN
ncbi:MAG: nucleoside hydrolase [Balneolaceae bacterium]|nr:MAG: nucleoside hydrolase [Balneolaceae bacterium]